MKTWSKNDITHDLVFQWFDKQLLRQSKHTIVTVAPRYNYIGNVLAFADHDDSKELEVLESIVNVFTLPFDLTDKDVYVEWKEILFHNWLKAKGGCSVCYGHEW